MVNMKMLTETKKVILCSEGLSKLGHILSMLCQAVKDNNCDPDDIEGVSLYRMGHCELNAAND